MDNCIFCKIVRNQIPAVTVMEDETLLAFMDINPVNKGHVLVIPKRHYPNMIETPDALVAELFIKSKKIMSAIKQGTGADFVVVSVVGVDVPHFHIHLLPRFTDDGLANFWPTKKYEAGEMEQYAEKIKSKL